MRLADVVLRRGHLSEAALVDAWNTGIRPGHLDHCDICAERALEVSHWLQDVQALGRAEADLVFTPERLNAQRGQILQRLEQLDRPAKVISFPARRPRVTESGDGRRISPAWLAAAAAAGLAIGVVSVELSHGLGIGTVKAPQIATAPAVPQTIDGATATDASMLFDDPYSKTQLGPSLDALDELTPRLVEVVAFNR